MVGPRSASFHSGGAKGDVSVPHRLYRRPHWFACKTRSRSEKKTALLLGRQGIDTYVPLVKREREWSDRTARVGFPVFPGYIFARFDLTRLHEVLGLPLVAAVARPNGYPTPVREEVLESVRRMVEGANEAGVMPQPEDFLAVGDPVKVVSGPFEGMEGILIEVKGTTRVAIRIPVLRQASSVEVSRTAVAPLKGPGQSRSA